jgi:cytochrome c-type biogenesis protein CcmE
MGIRNRQVAIAVGVILVAVIYVGITGMRDTMVYYYTVSEVSAQQAELTGEALRVAGVVVEGSIETDETGLVHKFVIEEGGKTMPVIYRDIVPDTFQDHAEAVVEGAFDADGTFHATFLMAKCPSKYEAESDYEQYRKAGVVAPSGGG